MPIRTVRRHCAMWDSYLQEKVHRIGRFIDALRFERSVRDLVVLSNLVDDHGCTLRPEASVELLILSGYPSADPIRPDFMAFG